MRIQVKENFLNAVELRKTCGSGDIITIEGRFFIIDSEGGIVDLEDGYRYSNLVCFGNSKIFKKVTDNCLLTFDLKK